MALASSPRSQVAVWTASLAPGLTCKRSSVRVRWRPMPVMAIVTYLVTRGLGWREGSVTSVRETFNVDRIDRMSDIFYGVAVARGLIEYERLAHRIGMQANHMTHLLAEVCRASVAEGGPMWTALCVSAHTERPQHQFHILARELRPEYAELSDEELWQAERQRCYDTARGHLVAAAE
jgi:hypothetical protein